MADAAVEFLLQNLVDLVREKVKPSNVSGPDDSRISSDSHIVHIPDLWLNQIIERVPPVFRSSGADRKPFEPLIVSIGPFHHRTQQFSHAESFKEESLQAFLSVCGIQDQSDALGKILDRIQDIRDSYGEELNYDNEELAQLILRDACFVIYHLASLTMAKTYPEWGTNYARHYSYFGPARIKLIFRDLLLLENQIPFWIIDLLLSLLSQPSHDMQTKNLVCRYLKDFHSVSIHNLETLLWANDQDKPFHILDAYYQTVVMGIGVDTTTRVSAYSTHDSSLFPVKKQHHHRYRSVTNLNDKGIHFKVTKPTQDKHLMNFESYFIFSRLYLPPLEFTTDFFARYSNLIAFELSPTTNTEWFVSSYVVFMKSLIEKSNDVRLLRENGILFNDMISDDEVVAIMRDLDTFGMVNTGMFLDLWNAIERHCRSKGKTWFAELIHDNFQNPWKAIALFAAIFLLVLTVLQTFVKK